MSARTCREMDSRTNKEQTGVATMTKDRYQWSEIIANCNGACCRGVNEEATHHTHVRYVLNSATNTASLISPTPAVCRPFVPRCCSLGSDTSSRRAGRGATAVVGCSTLTRMQRNAGIVTICLRDVFNPRTKTHIQR